MSEGNKEEENGMNAKAMLKEHGEKKTVIRYGERIKLEVLKATKFYRKGQIINPHTVMGKQLIKDKIAKKVVAD